MNPAQLFDVWRQEIADELAAICGELVMARSTLTAAEAAHAEARTEYHKLDAFAASAMRSPLEGTAGPLRSRVLNSRAALDAAASARGAARASVDSLIARAADFQLAIDQIDFALVSAKVAHLPRPAAAPARRRAAIVEFDDVVLPRDVAS